MKLFLISVILIVALASINLFGGDRVKILFKNGNQISGLLIDSVPGVSIKIKPDDFPATVFEIADIAQVINYDKLYPKRGIIGAGFGAEYGILGGTFEMHLPPSHFSLFGSVGTVFGEGIGWCIGGRFYFRNFLAAFQPRFTIFYGINNVLLVEEKDAFSLLPDYYYEYGSGSNVGLGFKWLFGETHNMGFDFDINYIVTSTIKKRINELAKQGIIKWRDAPVVDISFGFVIAFWL